MDDNVKKIIAGVLGLIAVVVLVIRISSSGGPEYDINSADPVERLAAVEDYRRDQSDASREVLIRVAESDKDIRVKISSIKAMRHNRGESTEQALRRMAREEPNARVRGEALAALSEYKNFPTTQLINALKTEPAPEVRMGAAKGLAQRADRSSAPDLFRALGDPDPQVRSWAITGIRHITKAGFLFNPEKEPNEQVDVINQIGNYLRRNGYM